MSAPQLYCSLDLELTGFDPLTDEILEVGFVFFSINGSDIVVHETWSQVFKPVKAVRPRILALTGITQTSIDGAPTFAEHREFLKSKLRNAILVGHSISVDKRFLEAHGVEILPEPIDTLDLAQIFLPTHHSYNLENLMHLLGVSHTEAHRALADAQTTIAVVKHFLNQFRSFSEDLQKEFHRLLSSSSLPWRSWFLDLALESNLPTTNSLVPSSVEPIRLPKAPHSLFTELPPSGVWSVPVTGDLDALLAAELLQVPGKKLLVVRDKKRLLRLYKDFRLSALFSPEDLFNETKFRVWIQRPIMLDPERKFALKVLVWKETNWQQLTILDLNISFFGTQYLEEVSGGVTMSSSDSDLVCIDYDNYLKLAESTYNDDRVVVIESIDGLYNFVTEKEGYRVGWNRLLHILKKYYNPELGIHTEHNKDAVLSGVAAVDLFFGLVLLSLKGFKSTQVSLESIDPYTLNKLQMAARHCVEKLCKSNLVLGSKELAGAASKLEQFFISIPNEIKWIEISDTRCSLLVRPKAASQQFTTASLRSKRTYFVTFLKDPRIIKFFYKGLGYTDLPITKIPSGNDYAIQIHEDQTRPSARDIIDIISSNLPAVVIFSEYAQLREFYDEYYSDIKYFASVFALGYSGGPLKLLKNYGLRPSSVLLATQDFVNSIKIEGIVAKNLIIIGNPVVSTTHPYISGLAQEFEGGTEIFLEVYREYYAHQTVRSFYTTNLAHIFLLEVDKDIVSSVESLFRRG